jgi:hypothetical protein
VAALAPALTPYDCVRACRWNYQGTARAASSRAILLELSRDDLDELLKSDGDLNESVGELRSKLAYMRSPKRLQQLWPFHGMGSAELDAIGDCMEPGIYDEQAKLFENPKDPCAALSMIVIGGVSALPASASGEPCGHIMKLGRDSVVGELEVLPPQKPVRARAQRTQRTPAPMSPPPLVLRDLLIRPLCIAVRGAAGFGRGAHPQEASGLVSRSGHGVHGGPLSHAGVSG